MFIKGSPGLSRSALRTYQEGYILPILSANELLFSNRHKELLRQFRDFSGLSSETHDQLYTQLIHRFVEFAQVLPYKPNGVLSSLIHYGLARASIVLQKYMQKKRLQTTPLLIYAIFSAALLKDLGRIISQQQVILVDQNGEYLKDWNPITGAMNEQADYYKIYQLSTAYIRIESEVTPILARQLMSEQGFTWLSSDLSVFTDWLAALLGQEGLGGKEVTWGLSLIKQEDLIQALNNLSDIGVDMQEPIATEQGEAFYKWLKESIASGDMTVNKEDSGVHLVEEGVFIDKKIFQQFVDFAKTLTNPAEVFAQFSSVMGITSTGYLLYVQYFAHQGGLGSAAFSSGLGQKTNTTREGMVVRADRVFSDATKMPTENSALKAVNPQIPENHKQPPSITVTSQKNLQSDFGGMLK